MYYLIYVLTILLLPVVLATLWLYEVWKKYKGYLLVVADCWVDWVHGSVEWAKRAIK